MLYSCHDDHLAIFLEWQQQGILYNDPIWMEDDDDGEKKRFSFYFIAWLLVRSVLVVMVVVEAFVKDKVVEQ